MKLRNLATTTAILKPCESLVSWPFYRPLRRVGRVQSVGRWVGKVDIATMLLFVVIPSRLTKSSRKHSGVQVAFDFSYICKNIQGTLI